MERNNKDSLLVKEGGEAYYENIPSLKDFPEEGNDADGSCIHCNKCMPSIYQGTHCWIVPEENRPGHDKWPRQAQKVGLSD